MTADPFSVEAATEAEAARVRKWRAALVAIVVVAVITFLTSLVNNRPIVPAALFKYSTIIALCNLLGCWLGIGSSIWRIPLSISGSLLIGWAEAATFTPSLGSYFWLYAILYVGITVATALACFVLTLLCGRLTIVGSANYLRNGLQFGVRHLLIWTTVVACLVALGRQFGGVLDLPPSVAGFFTTYIIGFSAVAVLEAWALLGVKLSTIRIVVVMIGLFVVEQAWTAISPGEHLEWSLLIAGSQTIFMAAIFCLRMQGYRFVKHQA